LRRFAIGEMQFAKCFAHQAFIPFPGVGAFFLADLFSAKALASFITLSFLVTTLEETHAHSCERNLQLCADIH
jgi:hypothetical protein